MEAHPGIVKAHPGAIEAHPELWYILGLYSVNLKHRRVTQEQPKLSLEQWGFTMDNGDHFLELLRLVMEL
jgi:hypothetical protein